ncbi:hypothetical protein L6452_22040 [Arctium lappa]|uniref:Uncharacterized protein n=1 Tax=Arctium lappa TaxID=4217 RepID=A0ACB9AZG5_ARCLA|nr:hypothetical protein L6452_22040 [Arctium lappa]
MSDYVCEELIAEIFGRLPPKSLLRFRSLSKSWCSRIVSPDFICAHASQSRKILQKILIRHRIFCENGDVEEVCTLHSENRLPLCPTSGYVGITPVDFPSNHSDIVGSCNGILCLFDHEIGIILWNPSIRRKLIVPHHPSLRDSSIEDTRVAVGFGFDPLTDDYKIVRIPYIKYKGATGRSFVYTIKTGAWRKIASPTTQFSDVKSWACCVNGTLHWVVKCYLTESDHLGHRYIMTFDLRTEVFGKISLPEPSWETRQLTIIKGSLAVISGECDNSWIWVRNQHNNVSSWSLFFKLRTLPFEGGVDKVLQLTTNGDFVFYTYSEGYKVYNPVKRVRSRLAEFKVDSYKVDIETYVESFALWNKGTACDGNRPSCSRPNKRSRK